MDKLFIFYFFLPFCKSPHYGINKGFLVLYIALIFGRNGDYINIGQYLPCQLCVFIKAYSTTFYQKESFITAVQESISKILDNFIVKFYFVKSTGCYLTHNITTQIRMTVQSHETNKRISQ